MPLCQWLQPQGSKHSFSSKAVSSPCALLFHPLRCLAAIRSETREEKKVFAKFCGNHQHSSQMVPDFSVLLHSSLPCPAGRARLILWCHQQPAATTAGWLRLSQGDAVLGEISLMCSLWWKQDVKHRMGAAIAFIAVLKLILLESYYHVFWTGAKNVNIGPLHMWIVFILLRRYN